MLGLTFASLRARPLRAILTAMAPTDGDGALDPRKDGGKAEAFQFQAPAKLVPTEVGTNVMPGA